MALSGTKQGAKSFAQGLAAEDVAASYLAAKGADILKSRYKTKFGEIDLIALLDGVLCFVEVKCRAKMEDALHAISPRGRGRIENSALFFLSEYPEYSAHDMRFDVIALSPCVQDFGAQGTETHGGEYENYGGYSLSHLDNAWQAHA